MNTVTKVFAVAALLASTSTIALGQEDAAAEQDAGVSGAAAEAETPEPPGVDAADDPHAEAAGVVDIDYEAVASSLQTSSVTAADIEAADTETDIQVVLLSELTVQAGEDATAIEEALASLEGGMDDLRAAMAENTEVAGALGAQGYAPEQVVGVATLPDGELVLVVDDTQ